MNKLWVALTLALTTNYGLAAAEKKVSEPKSLDAKPAVVLQVFDTSGKVAKPLKSNILSISKKQNQLCWTSVNLSLQNQKVTVVEAFYAPDSMQLASPGSNVVSSPDKKEHTVITEANNVSQQNVSRCWGFDHSDPIGKYRIDVQINNQVFKGLEFEIVK